MGQVQGLTQQSFIGCFDRSANSIPSIPHVSNLKLSEQLSNFLVDEQITQVIIFPPASAFA